MHPCLLSKPFIGYWVWGILIYSLENGKYLLQVHSKAGIKEIIDRQNQFPNIICDKSVVVLSFMCITKFEKQIGKKVQNLHLLDRRML